MSYGEQPQLSSDLVEFAPSGSRGPYKLGVPARRYPGKSYPQFELVDYTFVRNWFDRDAQKGRWIEPAPEADTQAGASHAST